MSYTSLSVQLRDYMYSIENDMQGLHKVLQKFRGNRPFQIQQSDVGFVEEMALKWFLKGGISNDRYAAVSNQ